MSWLLGIKGVVFDLDDTLLDHSGAVAVALHRWLPQLGLPADEATMGLWSQLEAKHWALRRAGVHTFQGQRRARVLEFLTTLGLPCPDPTDIPALDRVFAGFLAEYESAWTAFPDAGPAVAAVRELGLPVAILTNGSQDQQARKVAAIGLGELGGLTLTAEGLGVGKPDPRAYLAAAELLGLEPGTVLHVGDHPELDVVAADAAGVRGLLVDRTGRYRDQGLARISDLRELTARRRG